MSFWSDLGSSVISVAKSIPGVSSLPGVSGAMDAASNLFAKREAREAEDRAYNRQLDLIKLQNDWNVDMWNKTNQYNSPSNQLRLLAEAGLNPNLLGGSGANPTASAPTSASGSAPFDAAAGDRALQRSNSLLATLQTDAQIAKLRNEIKYQDMVNDDYRLLLDAHREERELPWTDADGYDNARQNPDGFLDVVNRKYNYYQEQRESERQDYRRKRVDNTRQERELETYIYSQPWLKKMPQRQLESLIKDIKTKDLNNQLLSNDVEMLKKYGISSKDSNAFTALLRAAVKDPDNVSRILNNLLKASFGVGRTLIDENYRPVRQFIDRFRGSSRHRSHANPVHSR